MPIRRGPSEPGEPVADAAGAIPLLKPGRRDPATGADTDTERGAK